MLRAKYNPAYPYHVVMLKHAPFMATEKSVLAHETRPDGLAKSEGTGYMANLRYGSQQSVTRDWSMPMHQTDTLFHAAGLIAGMRGGDPSAVAPGSVVLLPALALAGGSLYQTGSALYSAMRWPGPPPFTTAIFNAGELFAVLSPIGLWWAYGRGAARPAWLWGALPAAAFAVMRLVNPAMTGIVAIWSIGLTLYLPWPVYVASLWLAGVTVIAALRRDEPAGWAILLLAAGGYAPQLSTQVFAGLIALWLLVSAMRGAVVPAKNAKVTKVQGDRSGRRPLRSTPVGRRLILRAGDGAESVGSHVAGSPS